MKGLSRTCLIACLILALPAGLAWCCKIDGVIDWQKYDQHRKKVEDIKKDGWEKEIYPPWYYMAWDHDIFVPKDDHELGKPVEFGALTGAAVMEPKERDEWLRSNSPILIQIWAWVDVNCNRIADPDDKIEKDGKLVEQSWTIVASRCLMPNEGKNVLPSESVQGETYVDKDYFHPGQCYLLLIKVIYKGNDSNAWKCQLSGDCNHIQVVTGSKEPMGWMASGRGAYGDEHGHPFYSDVHWDGIDDWEIVWIRFNSPPSTPGPHGPTGETK